MSFITQASNPRKHLKSTPTNEFIFNGTALEVVIMERSGRPIWHQERGSSPEPLRWNGIDIYGSHVEPGSYLCKITYPDDLVVYVPFVFLQK